MKKIGVVIGRFQPFHNGHAALINKAVKDSDEVLIIIGSSNEHRSLRNPFTYSERKQFILDYLKDYYILPVTKFSILGLPDYWFIDDNEWYRALDDLIYTYIKGDFINCSVTIYGGFVEDISYMYKSKYKIKSTVLDGEEKHISATLARRCLYTGDSDIELFIPENIVKNVIDKYLEIKNKIPMTDF